MARSITRWGVLALVLVSVLLGIDLLRRRYTESLNQRLAKSIYLALIVPEPYRGDGSSIRRWLGRGASPHVRDSLGGTLLMAAAKLGSTSLMREALAAGIDVNAYDLSGNTALHYAANAEADPSVLQILITRGADVNSQPTGRSTPLMHAVASGNVAIAEALIDAGADVNAFTSDDGETALTIAAQFDNLQMIRMLIARGANIHAKHRGQTALKVAAKEGGLRTVRFLKRAGARE